VIFLAVIIGPLAHSAVGVFNTEYFGYYKHWHQRELLEYLNENFQEGDAVYIYWNIQISYDYYKNIYNYKFKPVEAADHRRESRDYEDYLSKIKADMNVLKKKYKRVWVIYGNHLFVNIGDYDNDPHWYYNTDNHLALKHAAFATLGKQVDAYKNKEEINLYLFEVETSPDVNEQKEYSDD
jgi:hypothetical protein